jgi:hypothetical protein
MRELGGMCFEFLSHETIPYLVHDLPALHPGENNARSGKYRAMALTIMTFK